MICVYLGFVYNVNRKNYRVRYSIILSRRFVNFHPFKSRGRYYNGIIDEKNNLIYNIKSFIRIILYYYDAFTLFVTIFLVLIYF